MKLEDIIDPAWSELRIRRVRDQVIDEFLDGMTDADVAAIVEEVAKEQEAAFAPFGAIVRRCKDPRKSPLVRAKLFELMPAPVRQMRMLPGPTIGGAK